jgi:hypothetical protein
MGRLSKKGETMGRFPQHFEVKMVLGGAHTFTVISYGFGVAQNIGFETCVVISIFYESFNAQYTFLSLPV